MEDDSSTKIFDKFLTNCLFK